MSILFKRPYYTKSSDKLRLLTESPLLLVLFAFVTNRNGMYWYPVFLWGNVLEEFLLRCIPLIVLDRHNYKVSILLGCIFSLYYHDAQKGMLYLMICFMMGTLYAFAKRKYSIIEMIMFRILFTVWIYD